RVADGGSRGGADPPHRRKRRFGVCFSWPCPSSAGEGQRPLAGPSRGRWRWPAPAIVPPARRGGSCEFPRARTRPPASWAPCPHAWPFGLSRLFACRASSFSLSVGRRRDDLHARTVLVIARLPSRPSNYQRLRYQIDPCRKPLS